MTKLTSGASLGLATVVTPRTSPPTLQPYPHLEDVLHLPLCSWSAASLICSGNEGLGEIGRALYYGLSPRLGHELTVDSQSKIPKMKQAAKVRITRHPA